MLHPDQTISPATGDKQAPQPLQPVEVRAKFLFEGEQKFFLKGVTYGPFAPDAEGFFVGNPDKARKDFELVVEMGANLLRIYHVPS